MIRANRSRVCERLGESGLWGKGVPLTEMHVRDPQWLVPNVVSYYFERSNAEHSSMLDHGRGVQAVTLEQARRLFGGHFGGECYEVPIDYIAQSEHRASDLAPRP